MRVKFRNLEISYVLIPVTSLFDVPEERTIIVPVCFSVKEGKVDGCKLTLGSQKTELGEPNTFKIVDMDSLYLEHLVFASILFR